MRRRVVIRLSMAVLCFLAGVELNQAAGSAKLSRQAKAKKTAPAGPARRNAPDTRIYVVKGGDTLFSIARSTGSTIAAIKSANGMRSSRLQIGQKLRISSPKLVLARNAGAATATAAGSATPVEKSSEPPPAESGTVSGSEVESIQPGGWEGSAETAAEGTGSPTGQASQPLRIQLASTGMGLLGTRYRWNGNSESTGFDCSGFVKSVFEKFKIILPRSSREQFKVGETIPKDGLEIGDLVFFGSRGKTPTHVGIYLGDSKFVHAARKAKGVLISSLASPWYTKRFLGGRRLLELWAEDPPASAETKSN